MCLSSTKSMTLCVDAFFSPLICHMCRFVEPPVDMSALSDFL